MTLYKFLVVEKHYTEAEAEETCIRFEFSNQPGMELPGNVKKDIQDYYTKHYAKPLK